MQSAFVSWLVLISAAPILSAANAGTPIDSVPATAPVGGHVNTTAPTSQPAGGCPIVCDEPTYDFGTVWGGSIVSHEFEIRNISSETVWVEVMQTSGTHARIFKRIEAYGSTRVLIRAATPSYSGKLAKRVTVKVVPPPESE